MFNITDTEKLRDAYIFLTFAQNAPPLHLRKRPTVKSLSPTRSGKSGNTTTARFPTRAL